MSMMSQQAKALCSWADQLAEREDEFGVVVRALVADLREAADTIESMGDRLRGAELGSGTCCIVKTPSDSDYVDDWRYRCSECGCNISVNERDPETGDVINAANYCPNCGAKVEVD